MRPVRAAARAMLSAAFIAGGARALTNPDPLVGRAKPVANRLAPALERIDPRLPTDPRRLVQLNAAVQVAAGMLLASGRLTRPAAALLAGSLVPTTATGHQFWLESDPTQRRRQQSQFLKNLGLLGGLLLAAADTEGQPGLRWRAQHLAGSMRRSSRRAARTAVREAVLVRAARKAGRKKHR